MYFIFKGTKSIDLGVEISKYTDITRAQKNSEKIIIAGRDGAIYKDIEGYQPYILSFGCIINKLDKNVSIDRILNWLTGGGDLILSEYPTKKYIAKIINNISIADVISIFPEFQVNFEVQPFKYNTNQVNDTIILTKSAKVKNKGTYKALPIITIYGNSDIDLIINNKIYNLKGVDEKITINSEIMEVYKDSENQNNKYNSFEFPLLEEGINNISFTGNVKKIIIEPKWRWF